MRRDLSRVASWARGRAESPPSLATVTSASARTLHPTVSVPAGYGGGREKDPEEKQGGEQGRCGRGRRHVLRRAKRQEQALQEASRVAFCGRKASPTAGRQDTHTKALLGSAVGKWNTEQEEAGLSRRQTLGELPAPSAVSPAAARGAKFLLSESNRALPAPNSGQKPKDDRVRKRQVKAICRAIPLSGCRGYK